MRAIVLGVSGMTGRAIARELAGAGWQVAGTGRDASHFPAALRELGVAFVRSDRGIPTQLDAVLRDGADLVVDCVAYTSAHAHSLVDRAADIGSIVALSSKAVYVDARGRHSNSDEPPDFGGPVAESTATLEPDFSGEYQSRNGYGSNKVAMERTLLEASCAVSVLRPSRIHGPGSARPREWFVVRRLRDGRSRLPLAHGGRTGNHPTAAANLARLVRVCAEHPGTRILNAADPDTPSAADIVAAIAEAANRPLDIVGLPDDAPDAWGRSPWDTWPPFFLDMSAAEALGYIPVGTYPKTVMPSVQELLALTAAQAAELDADPYFEGLLDVTLDEAALAAASGL
ncbi:NAD-dependent epimerase/dehydratase family protein [Microbacterium protaetiae]|uniref:NAD-dependent epimerase/dehydratase family protein n=1 Tax=Microbacterium protaetiae TaxID=2509458 RepID=A0A4P6EE18_9MICO|nr:NAD-dependent epimerase/dehydratase family protein [Microbacterium protaetiae]QAY59593.1 NAD-dependent epimerase/dehydratase family protein [Microbacterium protaetiae]